MTKVYLLAEIGHDFCTHERVYATREMAERNFDGSLRTKYAQYLARHAKDVPSQLPGADPTPVSYLDWVAREHGLVIEELEMIG